jgi:hypothetical protein
MVNLQIETRLVIFNIVNFHIFNRFCANLQKINQAFQETGIFICAGDH